MRELTLSEIDEVSGAMTPAEGAAATLALIATGPIGFATGFGIAVSAGLFYIALM